MGVFPPFVSFLRTEPFEPLYLRCFACLRERAEGDFFYLTFRRGVPGSFFSPGSLFFFISGRNKKIKGEQLCSFVSLMECGKKTVNRRRRKEEKKTVISQGTGDSQKEKTKSRLR